MITERFTLLYFSSLLLASLLFNPVSGNSQDFLSPTCDVAFQNPIVFNQQVQGEIFTMIQLPNPSGPFPLCSGQGTPSNTSWISFIAGPNATFLDLDIGLVNCNFGPNGGIQWGIVSDCNFTEVVCDASCSQGPVINVNANNIIPGQQYWLWLNGCNGSSCDFGLVFNTGLDDLTPCTTNSCGFSATTLSPQTDLNGQFDFTCVQGCMTGGVPQTITTFCGVDSIPTVWYRVETDAAAEQLFLTVETTANWTPVFSVYNGTCNNLSPIFSGDSPFCNTDWNNPSAVNHDISGADDFWIAIGALGEADEIMYNPDFEICVSTTIDLVTCLGTFGGECDDLTDWELMSSSNMDQQIGPITDISFPNVPTLCPGETIEVCGTFTYDASPSGLDWLIGITPILGEGWDLSAFGPTMTTVTANGMQGVWHDDGTATAPILQESVSSLCTYTDSSGNLQVCNALCSSCPCTPGMNPQDPLPGGWFWITNGSNAGCLNDGSPGEGWGIGTAIADVSFCFDLTVRNNLNINDCSFTDLTVGLQTFSDGVAGCRDNPMGECLNDEAQLIRFKLSCTNTQYFADLDMDGFGDPDNSVTTCSRPQGFVSNGLDCDDTNPSFNPNGTEVCDGIDNNCDGQIDEGISAQTYFFDLDGDGFGDPNNSIQSCFQPMGALLNDLDCNDADGTINPGAVELCDGIDNNCDGQIDDGLTLMEFFLDLDGDGYGDPNNSVFACSQPPGTLLNNFDCNDADANISPSAPELCDGIDNNCNGQIDDGLNFQNYFRDLDGDGFGDPDLIIVACSQPSGAVLDNLDCNDADASINPGATEICDNIDNNCDGQIDEGLATIVFYFDTDFDGFGDPNNSISSCFQPAGTVLNDQDCDDNDNSINPGSSELCDGIDNDCDGQIDEGLSDTVYFFDNDMDGFGDPNNSISSCSQPTGTVTNDFDCNDANASINPAATELCDDIDNNCDGLTDEGLLQSFFADNDMDGFGDPNNSMTSCVQPTGFVTNNLDCNDADATINPGAAELCDGIDNDCDGQIDEGVTQTVYYFDNDMDGFGDPNNSTTGCTQPAGTVLNDQDCDDADANINPGATELCDEIDNNCDGQIDEGLTLTVYYFDNDMDSFGNPNNFINSCTQPAGTVLNNQDCNDTDATINPNASELCDGIDNNCNGQIDEGLTTQTYYPDMDMDGFGNPASSILSCTQPAGYVLDNTDCDDTDSTVNPSAPELCDGQDNNCDTQIDEGLTFQDYFADNDMDGFGNPEVSLNACEQPPLFVLDNTDCDDTDAGINPSAEEIDGNGIDEDCDGTDGISATHDLAGTTIEIFPNPTNGFLNIGLSQNLDTRIELFSLDGKRVLEMNNVEKLDISSYNDGVYLLRITDLKFNEFVIERVVKSN
jgi:hypothetical protein